MNEAGKIQLLDPSAMAAHIDALERRNAELEVLIVALRAEHERLKRQQHPQAAPYRKEMRVAQPKRPGRKPGQGPFRYRPAPQVEALNEAPLVVPVTEPVSPHCGGS